MPLRLTGARIKKRGKLKKSGLQLTVKNTVLTGTGRGTVPKRTPKALRSGLRAIASGRLAAKLSGSVSLLGNDDLLGKGSGTLLVRSRKSRKTQVCLKLSAPKQGGAARLKVLGATGKAAGPGGHGHHAGHRDRRCAGALEHHHALGPQGQEAGPEPHLPVAGAHARPPVGLSPSGRLRGSP